MLTRIHRAALQVLQATSAESMRHMEVNDQLPGANRHSDAPKTRKVGHSFLLRICIPALGPLQRSKTTAS